MRNNLKLKNYPRRWFGLLVLLLIGALSLTQLSLPVASAHESRTIDNGKYVMRVGFLEEPTYQGLENGLDLTVCQGTCVSDPATPNVYTNGVTGAFNTLQAEVIYGSQSMTLTISPVAPLSANPGRYLSRFVPTKAGDYTFHIYGTINSDKVDERFTSGPDTFDPVLPLTAAQFPDKPGYVASATGNSSSPPPVFTVPATANSAVPTVVATVATTAAPIPTTSSSMPDMTSNQQLQTLQTQLATQQQQLTEARNNANSANSLALIGVVIGIIGIILAGVAFWLARSKQPHREAEGG